MRAFLKSFIVGLTMATTATTGESAAALSYDNILGKWCGLASNPNPSIDLFTRDALTVTFPSRTVVLKIDHYNFSDSTVIMHYFAAAPERGSTPGQQVLNVTFENFSSDGQTMDQRPNEQGGRYRFKRC